MENSERSESIGFFLDNQCYSGIFSEGPLLLSAFQKKIKNALWLQSPPPPPRLQIPAQSPPRSLHARATPVALSTRNLWPSSLLEGSEERGERKRRAFKFFQRKKQKKAMSSSSCSPAAAASVGGLVLFGTTTSLLAKIGKGKKYFVKQVRKERERKRKSICQTNDDG